jgi:sporulation protein YlmC with PRC-barrel domain
MLCTNPFSLRVAALTTTTALLLPVASYGQTTWTYSDIDADGNLELSDVEFERYSTGLFERYDADADGVLTSDEYVALEQEMGSFGAEPFEAWDADRDGGLTADEFNTGLYDTYDSDNSLGINETEYAAYGMGEETVGGMDNTVQAGEVISLSDWSYDPLYTDGISVEALLDAEVIDATGEDVGDVENVLFGPGGELVSVIVEVGGFLDIGDTHLNIPWDMVETAGYTADSIVLPFTEDQLTNVNDYGLFNEEYGYGYDEGYGETEIGLGEEGLGDGVGLDDVTNETVVASEQIGEVGGDGAGVVETGPRVWRAPDLIGDYARVRDGDAFMNYGYVEDIIVRDGQIAAVLVSGDQAYGGGYRAFPYTGYGYANGWTPGLGYYDLPYDRTDVEALEPFEDDQILDY